MSCVKVKKEDHVAWLTLNKPDTLNALDLELIEALTTTLKKLDRDSNIYLIVLSGAGKAFSAGGNIKDMASKKDMFAGNSAEVRLNYEWGIQQIPLTIRELNKPIIAMINGDAVGAGCDLASMCDLRIASSKARMGVSFAKLSLVPGDGGTYFLPRVVGYSKAMVMLLTGKLYSSNEALEMGLVLKVCEPEKLLEQTQELVNQVLLNAPVALSMIRKAMENSRSADLLSHLDLLAAYQGIAQRTDDHFEGLAALREKRKPDFKNS